MIPSSTPIRRLLEVSPQSSDSPKAAREFLTEESTNREDGEEESREKRINRVGQEAEVLTYKRRSRIRGQIDKPGKGDESDNWQRISPAVVQKRKSPDDRELESPENGSIGEIDIADVNQSTLTSGTVSCRSSKVTKGLGRGETLPTIKTWERVIGIQKTLAPKRVTGQYFLDLGQSDFSYTTCPICGLFYARGHENDEKVHKTFHRNLTQGILFKGWQSERVATRLDDKGNRVIVVLAEDSHHQAKVREVIDVMELELGLTPGWLLQRSCKVYLFISSSKKIVGCLMAEPIKSAFPVVSAQGQSSRKAGKLNQSDGDDEKPSSLKADLQSHLNESSSQLNGGASELPATRIDESAKSKQRCVEGESCLLPKPSPAVSSVDASSPSSLSSISASTFAAPGHPRKCISNVNGALPHARVGEDRGSVKDRTKTPKITDFFALKPPRAGSHAVCKSERDVIDCKADVKGTYVKLGNLGESSLNFFVSGQDKQKDCRQLEYEKKLLPKFVSEASEDKERPLASGSEETVCKSERDVIDSKADVKGTHVKVENEEGSSPNSFVWGLDKEQDCRHLGNEEKVPPNFVSSAADDKGKPSASGITDADGQDADTRKGRHHRTNVMVFGNIKFLREMPSRKRASKERAQDLGSAILCTKTPVPAVCGVRVIWVSHTERRKGIASHLLDAMRKTFCLGVVLEPSQFAFSQPTPEGRKFAAWYCKSNEFLVYTTS